MSVPMQNIAGAEMMDQAIASQLTDAYDVRSEARRLGLERHLLELHTYGFTVVPPETLGEPELVDRLRDAMLRVLAERNNVDYPHDWLTRTEPFVVPDSWNLLLEDDVFIETLLHPVAMCFAHFLCGKHPTFKGNIALVKTAANATDNISADGYMHLHSDLNGIPSPMPTWGQLVNVSWIMSDYNSSDDGPTVLIPGSHRFGKEPLPFQAEWWKEGSNLEPVSLIAKSGSLAVWNGAVWHGSRPKRTPGMRIALPNTYFRSNFQTIEDWPKTFASGEHDAVLERFPQLASVLGLNHSYPHHASSAQSTPP